MAKKFERCIKVIDQKTIWAVKGTEKVKFETWEEYEAAGKPPFEIVTQEQADAYTTVERFSRQKKG